MSDQVQPAGVELDAALLPALADRGTVERELVAGLAIAGVRQAAGEHPGAAVVIAALGALQQQHLEPRIGSACTTTTVAASRGTAAGLTSSYSHG